VNLAAVPKRDPPSKGRVWLGGCGIAALLGLIAFAGLMTITFLAMHSSGACMNGDDIACKRACFGISSDPRACGQHGDTLLGKGDRAEAQKAYKQGCDDGDEPSCTALKALREKN
jgi:hypothetical protein